MASHSHNLLSCTKHRIGVLRSSKEVILCNLSSKMTFSAKKLKLMKSVFCIAKNMFISLERIHFSCSLSFALKIAFSNFFSTEKEAFEHLWPRILIICLVCTKHRIGVLRSSKEVILCN